MIAGKPGTHAEDCLAGHIEARRNFDELEQIGSMPTEDDDGNPVKLRLANCRACRSTIAMVSP